MQPYLLTASAIRLPSIAWNHIKMDSMGLLHVGKLFMKDLAFSGKFQSATKIFQLFLRIKLKILKKHTDKLHSS